MRTACFTIASIISRIKTDPFPFESISRFKCKRIMNSYPNGLSRAEIKNIFDNNHLGEYYFKRGSNVFMLDLEEESNSVVLHCIMSNDNDPSSFINSYKNLKDKVEYEHAVFFDMRFPNSSK